MHKLLEFLKGLFQKPRKVVPHSIVKKVVDKIKPQPKPEFPYLKDLYTVILRRGAPRKRFDILIREFKKHAAVYEVNTPLRIAHFWAQMAHETGGFRWFNELGNRQYFSRYDGREDLGNTEPGDGYRFRGRGIIHLTGRHNYEKFGKKIGVDLISNPSLASHPHVAILVALEYWNQRKLNKYADADDIRQVTRRINGGYNGLRDRQRYLDKIKGLDG